MTPLKMMMMMMIAQLLLQIIMYMANQVYLIQITNHYQEIFSNNKKKMKKGMN